MRCLKRKYGEACHCLQICCAAGVVDVSFFADTCCIFALGVLFLGVIMHVERLSGCHKAIAKGLDSTTAGSMIFFSRWSGLRGEHVLGKESR